MIVAATDIRGAWLVDIEPIRDERGFFARSLCPRELERHGISFSLAQQSVAFSNARGTLRGLHWQAAPWEEDKLVRCTQGAAYVVAADVRPDSATRGCWIGVELSAENHRSLLVPKGCAQGYLTLRDDTEIFYQVSEFHRPEAKRGVRFDDPALAIRWPIQVQVIAQADREWPDLDSSQGRMP